MGKILLRWARVALVGTLLGALAGCGGGSSSAVAPVGTGPSDTSVGTAKTLAVDSFSPSIAVAGTTVTVNGSALDTVTTVSIGPVTTAFTIESPSRLRFDVPPTATTGRIVVANGGATAQSGSDLQIGSAVAVASVTPTTVLPPARISVTGSRLDLVRQALLGGAPLLIATQTASALALDVPAGAATAELTLVDAAGVSTRTPYVVTVASPMTVTSLSPASVSRGAPLTIGGTHLDRATAVQFSGGATAAVASRSGSTSITVTVPDTATGGPVTVLGNLDDSVVSSVALTVLVPIVVDGSAIYTLASVPASLTIPGSGLMSVSGVTVGTISATITAKSDTALTVTVPSGISCGPITLSSPTQPAVAAGSIVVGSGCSARAAGLEFAQVLSQAASDTYQRLVPGKTTLVRAYVVSEAAGTPAPTVRLTGFDGTAALGSITMAGPDTLPQLASGAAPPDSLRYDQAMTFNAIVPTSWVRAGLRVRVDVGSHDSIEAAPQVGSPTRIDLVLVPLVSGAQVPTLPSAAAVTDELVRRLTLPREAISLSVRQPYTLSSTSDGVDSSSEWSAALSELENLRRREAPGRHYYGFVRPMVSSGIAGIGYVNSVGSTSPSLAALGWDASRSSWAKTFIHELGHNFSRQHAPCGSVSSTDPNYPYNGGVLSPTPLYESIIDDIVSPANQYDVMGYCNGVWFSDYNLRQVQRFMEAQPQPAGGAAGSSQDADRDLIVVAGRIDAEGVRLEPLQRLRGRVSAPPARSDYRLRLHLQSGAQFEVPLDAVEVDHVDEKHFVSLLPAPGALAGIEVLHQGMALPVRAGHTLRPAPTAGPSVQWREVGDTLQLRWNSDVYETASVTHVAATGERTVLALQLRGGSASVGLAQVPGGGEFELSLSSGLDAQLLVLKR